MKSDEEKEKVALFRYQIISSLVATPDEYRSNSAFFREQANKKWIFNGKEIQVSASSVRYWFTQYSLLGLDGLTPKTRSDSGDSRKLNYEVQRRLKEILEQYPKINATVIYQKLLDEEMINKTTVSLSSVQRFIKINGLREYTPKEECRAFEARQVNYLWQADTTYSLYMKISGKKRQVYLQGIIDDKSRFIVGWHFVLNDSAINFQKVFKQAILKRGKPSVLYVDNGSAFRNHQLYMICAEAGISIVHSRPYKPRGRGKIERVFRTFKESYLHVNDWNGFDSLEHLTEEFKKYLQDHYHNKVHSTTKQTPNDRWHSEYDNLKFIPKERLDEIFLHKKVCKVANDGTIRTNNQLFEAPAEYLKQNVNVVYAPSDRITEIYLITNAKQKIRLRELNRQENNNVKRNTIGLYGGEN